MFLLNEEGFGEIFMGGISQACRKRPRDNTGIWSDLISRRCGSNRPAWRRWMAGH
jgi:hypothetical protein